LEKRVIDATGSALGVRRFGFWRLAMLDRSQLALAVAHADVATDMAFHSSADYFHTREVDRNWWKDVRTLAQVIAPLTFAERAFVIVEGQVQRLGWQE
jgi:hypothetical protein